MRAHALAIVVLLAGCAGKGSEGDAPPPRVEWHGTQGGVSMTLRAEPGAVTVGERLRLTVEVLAPAGVAVIMPEVKDELGPFKVRARRTPPDVPQEGKRLWESVLELDTFAAGDAEIPALTVKLGDPAEELTSEPLRVTVNTVLAEDQKPDQHRDIKAPVALRGRGDLARALVFVIPALAAAALGAALLALRRRRGAAAPIVPPQERALRELAELEAEGLPQRGSIHEFYSRLADIVRRYLEGRFGILAPERTTEEFLRETRTSSGLAASHKEMLGRFLRAADMVKFALDVPGPQEAAGALESARAFVQATRPLPAAEAAA